ncbi:MAG: polymer-forming cytoskeletal protein [Methanoregulaceae archaeon]
MKSSGESWQLHCHLPDGTELQEHRITTGRNIVIGDHCEIEYGIRGDEVIVGEATKIREYVWAEGDVRIGSWCEIGSDIITKQDAYIGEGVKIFGKLIVYGDLDIGENVVLAKGYEARGGIEVRNPIPVMMYLLLYFMTLLHLQREEDVEKFLNDLFSEENPAEAMPLMIPRNSHLTLPEFRVPSSLVIGKGCRLYGNIRSGKTEVQENTVIFGSLRARGGVIIDGGTAIHGAVESRATVRVRKGAHILGNVIAKSLVLHEDARVDGTITAPHGLIIEGNS